MALPRLVTRFEASGGKEALAAQRGGLDGQASLLRLHRLHRLHGSFRVSAARGALLLDATLGPRV